MRVLVVEDYDPIRTSVVKGLREAGYAVDEAADGQQGLGYAQFDVYDVIVLDLMLPKVDGLTVLKRLRERRVNANVLILTAKDAIDDRVAGLDLGADDYLVKPFAFDELLARIRTLVRRRYSDKNPVIRVSDLCIDTTKFTVQRAGKIIHLTAREYALLEYLARRSGQVVSRSDIWEHVYDFRADVSSNVVDVYVGYLRRKIERDGLPKLIHTRRGQGYSLGEMP